MFAKLTETTLFFDVVGAGLDATNFPLKDKPVMVLLNGGYGFDHAYLRQGLDDLAEDYQLLYIDMRGQGRSFPTTASSITFEKMADDVSELMAVLGIDSAFIFGHASGSFVAQKVAMRYPSKVLGLILVSSSMGMSVLPGKDEEGYPTPFLKDRVQGDALDIAHHFFYYAFDITEEDYQTYFNQIGPYYMAPSKMDLYPGIFKFVIHKMDLVNRFRSITPFYNSLGKVDQITCPCLVLAGIHDWATPTVGSFMLSKKLSNCQYVEFDGSGHFLFIEEHQRFKDLVIQFVTDHS